MDMTADAWRLMFQSWPKEIPRQGMIKTKLDESIPFVDFLTQSTLLLVDRGKPDAQGARKVILPMEQIAAIKIAGMLDLSAFELMGFMKNAF